MNLVGFERQIKWLFERDPPEEELHHLLEKASIVLGEPSGDIMVRLSTYPYGGKVIPGEKSVYQLSQRRQEVVISKLKVELKGKEEVQCFGKS